MRYRLRVFLGLLVATAGCRSDDVLGVNSLQSAVELKTTSTFDSRIDARIDVTEVRPGSVLTFPVRMTNNRLDTIVGGVCAERVDGRRLGEQTWYDVTVDENGCNRSALVLNPGQTGTITASVDQAKLRAVAGGAGGTVFVRVRHAMLSDGPVGIQTVELPYTVP